MKNDRTGILRKGGKIHWDHRNQFFNMKVVIPSNSTKKTLNKYEKRKYRI